MCVGPLAPKMPKPPPMPVMPEPAAVKSAPTRDDPAVNEAATATRRRRLLSKGRKSTILTGTSGDTASANVGKTLLGA